MSDKWKIPDKIMATLPVATDKPKSKLACYIYHDGQGNELQWANEKPCPSIGDVVYVNSDFDETEEPFWGTVAGFYTTGVRALCQDQPDDIFLGVLVIPLKSIEIKKIGSLGLDLSKVYQE